jgi:hypothetical protein
MQHQEKDNWCWSALTVSVLAFYRGEKRTQCEHANRLYRDRQCCDGGEACDLPTSLRDSLTDAGVLREYLQKTLSFDEVRAEVAQGRIVCARIAWDDGGYHFLAIDNAVDGARELSIKDPMFGVAVVTYDALLRYREVGRWIESYTTHP